MTTSETQTIDKLLSVIEGVIENNYDALSVEDLEDYIIAALKAHKETGRPRSIADQVLVNLEGEPNYVLHKAGIL